MNEALLKISEIFRSIQGESSYAGWPCAFIRLAGCSHNCRYCDSLYARNTEERLTTREVVSRALALKTEIIEITGGEPLEQPGVHQLMTELCNTGRKVLLETGGFIPVAGIDPRVHKIIDLKPPSSGESGKNCMENITLAFKAGKELQNHSSSRWWWPTATTISGRETSSACILFRNPALSLWEWLPVSLRRHNWQTGFLKTVSECVCSSSFTSCCGPSARGELDSGNKGGVDFYDAPAYFSFFTFNAST